MKRTDLGVVDDVYDIRYNLVEIARQMGLSAKAFASGSKALKYLGACSQDEIPLAWIVDMKTCPWDLEDPENEKPEEIYWFLEKRGRGDYFRFNTGNLSQHDREVQKRTGARVFDKGNDCRQYVEFFQSVIDYKLRQGKS